MGAGLLFILFVMARGYSGDISTVEPDEIYSGPVLRIRAACKRIENHLAEHVDIGNLDRLYHERSFSKNSKKAEPEKVAVHKKISAEHPAPASASIEKLQLNGVAWSRHNPIAFVNGTRVSTGDKIGVWRVVEITANSVRLKDGQGNSRQLLIQYGRQSRKSAKEKHITRKSSGTVNY
jgi:hypothetical protein